MKKLRKLLIVAASASFICGCSDTDLPAPPTPPPPPPAMASFDVTVENLTNAQPLSPVAVVAHQSGYSVFAVGDPATVGLEELAEGGDNTRILADADADTNVVTTVSGGAPIGPAGVEIITVNVLETDLPALQISVASMVVNTNDAFSAINAVPLDGVAVGESWSAMTIAYDAGTEADSEAAADIPGPAGGGEGFNATRSDSADRVAMHSGVISQDDGFAASDLSGQHRFDNPVMRVSITRTQ